MNEILESQQIKGCLICAIYVDIIKKVTFFVFWYFWDLIICDVLFYYFDALI